MFLKVFLALGLTSTALFANEKINRKHFPVFVLPLESISSSKDEVILGDGSIWKIKKSDIEKVISDAYVVRICKNYSSKYQFFL